MARAAGAVPDARAVGDGPAAEGQPVAVGPDVDVEGRDLFRRRGASQTQRARRARFRRLGGGRPGDAAQHQHCERPAKAPLHSAGSGRGDREHHDRSLSAPNSTRPSAPTVHEVMGFQW